MIHWLDTTPVESTDKPCTVQSLDVKAHACGIYAEVTQTIVIENPNNRQISTMLAIPLPDRAIVCGYALDINDKLVDGVVVPKDEARVIFETEQRRMVDPGLVEAVRGNAYRTRVYPVPSRGTRTVRLSYVTPLILMADGSALLELPMPEEHLAKRTVHIEVENLEGIVPQVTGLSEASFTQAWGGWSLRTKEEGITPNGPVRLSLPELPSKFVLMERSDQETVWFCASRMVDHDDTTTDVPALTELTVLWDTSGSRAVLDHTRELELLRSYASADTIKQLKLITFADQVSMAIEFSSADELVSHIAELRYDGGTDLGELSRCLTQQAVSADVNHGSACVLFSDGLDTLDDQPFVLPQGIDVLSIVSGNERDIETLRQGTRGPVFDLAQAPTDAAGLVTALLHYQTRSMGAVNGTGIAEVVDVSSPSGERLAVIGKLTGPEATLTLGTEATTFSLHADEAVSGRVLSRAWAAKRVSLLAPRADENKDELLALGRRYGVVSPVTSLLVLDTLEQYLRYEVEPPHSLVRMCLEWRRAMRGRMQHDTDEGREKYHKRELMDAWSKFMLWWKGELPKLERYLQSDYERVAGRNRSIRASAMVLEDSIALPDSVSYSYSVPTSAPSMGTFARESAAMPTDAYDLEESSGSSDYEEPVVPSMSVRVKPWIPDAPYLKSLDEASSENRQTARDAYLELRNDYRTSPSFFLDCASWFFTSDDKDFGVTVLSNLAEMRIEDAALLRVMAWRLREAGELERALVVFRRIRNLRSEDSQSYRDLALVLSELARATFAEGKEAEARAYAEEAAELYRKVVFTPWDRRAIAIGLIGIEEYNVFRAWVEAQTWEVAPQVPSLGKFFNGVPDCDLRITLAWDADDTDVDLHVTEPSGEEAYYGHPNTYAGGRVSEDITDGYGPEQYSIKKAQEGTYLIRAHYYASHQQSVFGPATCTVTVFTDWGRATQQQHITTTRLEHEREMIDVGTACYAVDPNATSEDKQDSEPNDPMDILRHIEVGMTYEQVVDILGEPTQSGEVGSHQRVFWEMPNGRAVVIYFANEKVNRVIERMSWGDEMVIVQ